MAAQDETRMKEFEMAMAAASPGESQCSLCGEYYPGLSLDQSGKPMCLRCMNVIHDSLDGTEFSKPENPATGSLSLAAEQCALCEVEFVPKQQSDAYCDSCNSVMTESSGANAPSAPGTGDGGSIPEMKDTAATLKTACRRCQRSLPGAARSVAMCKFCEFAVQHLHCNKPLPENLELHVIRDLDIKTTREVNSDHKDSIDHSFGSPSSSLLSNPRVIAQRKINHPHLTQSTNMLPKHSHIAASLGKVGSSQAAPRISNNAPQITTQSAVFRPGPLNPSWPSNAKPPPVAATAICPQTSSHLVAAAAPQQPHGTPPASMQDEATLPPYVAQHTQDVPILDVFNRNVVANPLYDTCESCGSQFKPMSTHQKSQGLCLKCLKMIQSFSSRKNSLQKHGSDDEAVADAQCKVCFKDYPSGTGNNDLCPGCHSQMTGIIVGGKSGIFMATTPVQSRANGPMAKGPSRQCLAVNPSVGSNNRLSSVPGASQRPCSDNGHGSLNVNSGAETLVCENVSSVQIMDKIERLAAGESDVREAISYQEWESSDEADSDEDLHGLDIGRCSEDSNDTNIATETDSDVDNRMDELFDLDILAGCSGDRSSDSEYQTPDQDIDQLNDKCDRSHTEEGSSSSSYQDDCLGLLEQIGTFSEDDLSRTGTSPGESTYNIGTVQHTSPESDDCNKPECGLARCETNPSHGTMGEIDSAAPKPSRFDSCDRGDACDTSSTPSQGGPAKSHDGGIAAGRAYHTMACTHCGDMKQVERGWHTQCLLCTNCGEADLVDLNAPVEPTQKQPNAIQTEERVPEIKDSKKLSNSRLTAENIGVNPEGNNAVQSDHIRDGSVADTKLSRDPTVLNELKPPVDVSGCLNSGDLHLQRPCFDVSSAVREPALKCVEQCRDQPVNDILCEGLPSGAGTSVDVNIHDEALGFLSEMTQRLNESHEVNQTTNANITRVEKAINQWGNDMIHQIESQRNHLLQELDTKKNDALGQVKSYQHKLECMVVLIRNVIAYGSDETSTDTNEMFEKLRQYLDRVKSRNELVVAPHAPNLLFQATPLPQKLCKIQVVPATGPDMLCDPEQYEGSAAGGFQDSQGSAKAYGLESLVSVGDGVHDKDDEESLVSGDWDSTSLSSIPFTSFAPRVQAGVPLVGSADDSGKRKRNEQGIAARAVEYTEWQDDDDEAGVGVLGSRAPPFSTHLLHGTGHPSSDRPALASTQTSGSNTSVATRQWDAGSVVLSNRPPSLASLCARNAVSTIDTPRLVEAGTCDTSPLSEEWDSPSQVDQPLWKFPSTVQEGTKPKTVDSDNVRPHEGLASTACTFYSDWQDDGGVEEVGLCSGNAAVTSDPEKPCIPGTWERKNPDVSDDNHDGARAWQGSFSENTQPQTDHGGQKSANDPDNRQPFRDVEFIFKNGDVLLNFS